MSVMQARTPAQRWQTPALHWPDLQRPTELQRRRNARDGNSIMLAMTPVQWGWADSATPAKTTALPWPDPRRPICHGKTPGTATRPWAMTMSAIGTPRTATICDWVLTGQTPVHDAGGNTGATKLMMPAQQGQRCPQD